MRYLGLSIVLALGLLPTNSCQLIAAPVVPGQVLVITNSTNPDGSGTVWADELMPFEIRNGGNQVILSGLIQNRAVKSDKLGTAVINHRLTGLSSSNGTARIVRVLSEGFADIGIDITVPSPTDVNPNQVTRSAGAGDILDYEYNPNVITPPEKSTFVIVVTGARGLDFNGATTIYAEESPGGTVYSTRVEGMARPVAIQPGVAITSFAKTGPSAYDLTFEAELAGEYKLLWSNDLTNWTYTAGSIYTVETPHTRSITPFSGNPPAQFYRLELQ